MDRRSREESLFLAAIDVDAGEARLKYIDGACADDPALRESVLALLAADAVDRPESQDSRRDGSAAAAVRIGPYRLLERLGEGGMGVVYLAERRRPRRQVALKLIRPGWHTAQLIARFEAERRALAAMDHPNIARLLDSGSTRRARGRRGSSGAPADPGRQYFVMELVRGVPITRYCDERNLSLRARLELFIPVCRALDHAHRQGIVHRDVKPSNILVAEQDGRPVPKVIDFGVAKWLREPCSAGDASTRIGQLLGTLEYMSPEQAQLARSEVDTRTDVYSLGVLLYELVTGSVPVDRKRIRSTTVDELLRIIREEKTLRPSEWLSDAIPWWIIADRSSEGDPISRELRRGVDAIALKALEKDRERRYRSAGDLACDIERLLAGEPLSAPPPSPAERLRMFIRRILHAGLARSTAVFLRRRPASGVACEHGEQLERASR